jgi:hypothetical protein
MTPRLSLLVLLGSLGLGFLAISWCPSDQDSGQPLSIEATRVEEDSTKRSIIRVRFTNRTRCSITLPELKSQSCVPEWPPRATLVICAVHVTDSRVYVIPLYAAGTANNRRYGMVLFPLTVRPQSSVFVDLTCEWPIPPEIHIDLARLRYIAPRGEKRSPAPYISSEGVFCGTVNGSR